MLVSFNLLFHNGMGIGSMIFDPYPNHDSVLTIRVETNGTSAALSGYSASQNSNNIDHHDSRPSLLLLFHTFATMILQGLCAWNSDD
jgi:hypothetical protein